MPAVATIGRGAGQASKTQRNTSVAFILITKRKETAAPAVFKRQSAACMFHKRKSKLRKAPAAKSYASALFLCVE